MKSSTMLAVRQHFAGGPLQMEKINIPEPSKGQVLVKISAAPVNPSDLSFIGGLYGKPLTFPVVPGIEGSGTVIKSGGGMLAWLRNGKKVACTPPPGMDGTWAEYMVTDASRCIPLPKKIDLEKGSMMLVNPLSVMSLFSIIRNGKHRAVVNNAAASSLGKMLIKICEKKNISLINIVSSRKQEEVLMNSGAQHILNSKDPGFREAFFDLSRQLGVTLILDAIGGSDGSLLIEAAPENCKIILYAKLSAENIEIDPRDLLRNGKSIEGFQLGRSMNNIKLTEKLRLIRSVKKFIKQETELNNPRAIFSLEEVVKAIESYKECMGAGKVLLRP